MPLLIYDIKTNQCVVYHAKHGNGALAVSGLKRETLPQRKTR